MLKFYSLASTYSESGWAILPLSGTLINFPDSKVPLFRAKNLPAKVSSALDLCMDPYRLSPTPEIPQVYNVDAELIIKNIYARQSYLRRKNFFLSVLYSRIRKPLYETSAEVFSAIDRQFPEEQFSESCLQRTLTVIKTSKKFKTHGVLFIGAQIPLKNMHAWIIEDGVQPDKTDRRWINYLPLLALAY